jgi:hypothetical protein
MSASGLRYRPAAGNPRGNVVANVRARRNEPLTQWRVLNAMQSRTWSFALREGWYKAH